MAENQQPLNSSNTSRHSLRFSKLEGPKTLRFLCLIGGLAIICISVLNLVNVFRILFDPAAYLLNFCLAALGLLIICVESKEISQKCREFFERWAKFLTTARGKGLTYIFIGLLMTSQSIIILSPTFAVGVYMTALGFICTVAQPSSDEEPQDDAIV